MFILSEMINIDQPTHPLGGWTARFGQTWWFQPASLVLQASIQMFLRILRCLDMILSYPHLEWVSKQLSALYAPSYSYYLANRTKRPGLTLSGISRRGTALWGMIYCFGCRLTMLHRPPMFAIDHHLYPYLFNPQYVYIHIYIYISYP